MATTTVNVSGMSCGGCASKVSKAIGELDGVTEVTADPAAGTVVVTAETVVELTAIRDVLTPIGYQVRV